MYRTSYPNASNSTQILNSILPTVKWKAEHIIGTLKAMLVKAIQETDRDATGKINWQPAIYSTFTKLVYLRLIHSKLWRARFSSVSPGSSTAGCPSGPSYLQKTGQRTFGVHPRSDTWAAHQRRKKGVSATNEIIMVSMT